MQFLVRRRVETTSDAAAAIPNDPGNNNYRKFGKQQTTSSHGSAVQRAKLRHAAISGWRRAEKVTCSTSIVFHSRFHIDFHGSRLATYLRPTLAPKLSNLRHDT